MRQRNEDPRSPRDKDGSDYCHIYYFFESLCRLIFVTLRTDIKSTRAGVQMQTDLSFGVQQEQHDTHASWLPRASLFRVFTSQRDNCDFPDILILSYCARDLCSNAPSNVSYEMSLLSFLLYCYDIDSRSYCVRSRNLIWYT